MKTIFSCNPATEEILKEYQELKPVEVESKIQLGTKAFTAWKIKSPEYKRKCFTRLSESLLKSKHDLARLITLEVGKPIKYSVAEIEKCALMAKYFAENFDRFLKNKNYKTDASKSYIAYEPLGLILGIMPWNFPFWQTLRFAIPTVIAGNVVLTKLASNVPQCASKIEELFIESGFDEGVYQNIFLLGPNVSDLISDSRIKGISVTGSTETGRRVAGIAGKNLKKTVLELGGSDPYIVFKDADLKQAASVAAFARLQNNGQSCIAAKRFIIHKDIGEEFLEIFSMTIKNMKIGNPLHFDTDIGPMINQNALEKLHQQVNTSVESGAKILFGGKKIGNKGYFYCPTILTHINQRMSVFREETFGPVAPVVFFENEIDSVQIANLTDYGLGASIWTKNLEFAEKISTEIEAGSIFINGMVKSDPILPFGGIKDSGYGRELSDLGLKEFVNIKTISIK